MKVRKLKKLKRILSVALSAALLVTSIPNTITANDDISAEQGTEIASQQETVSNDENREIQQEETNQENQQSEIQSEETAVSQSIDHTDSEKENEDVADSTQNGEEENKEEADLTPTPSIIPTNVPSEGTQEKEPEEESNTKKEINVTWSIQNNSQLVWNKNNQQPTASAEGQNIEFTYTISKDGSSVEKAIEPGNYTVSAVAKDLPENLILKNTSISFVITKQPVAFSWGENTRFYYDGKEKSLSWSSDYEDAVKVTYYDETETNIVEKPTAVGNYKVVAELKDESHYVWTSSVDKNVMKIIKSKVTITIDPVTKTYGEKDPEFTYTVTIPEGSPVKEEDVRKNLDSLIISREAGKEDVGTYPLGIDTENISDDEYYTVGYNTQNATLTIKKYEGVKVTINSAAKVYGEADPEFTYNIEIPKNAPVDKNNVLEALKDLKITREAGKEDVGTYPLAFAVDATRMETPNYTIDLDTANATLTINKYTENKVNVTIKSAAKIYGEKDPKFEYEVTIPEGVPTSMEEVSKALENLKITREAGKEDVGTYPLILNTEEVAINNYEINFNAADAVLEIKKYEGVKITINSVEKIYGETDPEFTYNVVIPKGAPVTEAEVRQALASLVINRKDVNEDAGTYALSFDATNVAEIKNYSVDFDTADATLTIKKYEGINVIIDAKKKYYGEADPEFTYHIVIPENAPVTEAEVTEALEALAITRETGENVGSYVLSFDTTNVAEINDYTVAYDATEVVLKINALPITVMAAENQNKFYGQEDFWFEYAVSVDENIQLSLLECDGLTVEETIKEQLGAGIFVREAGENVAEYAYSLAADLNSNFIVSDGTSELTKFEIKQLPISVAAVENQNKIYGQPDETFEYIVSVNEDVELALLESDEKTVEETIKEQLGADIYVRESGENVAEYAFSLMTDLNSNFAVFDVTEEFVKFEIKQLPITVTAIEGQNKIYGQNDPTFEFSVLVNEDKATLSLLQKDGKTVEETIKAELGTEILTRAESVKTETAAEEYKYQLSQEAEESQNYAITYNGKNKDGKEITFVINKIAIHLTNEANTEISQINSRQGNFTISTDLNTKEIPFEDGEQVNIKVSISKHAFSEEIGFKDVIEAYIEGADKNGVIAFEKADTANVSINDVTYTLKARKDGEKDALTWIGKLPAGTELEISMIDASGNVVSNTVKLEVAKTNVSLGNWNGYRTNSAGNAFVYSENGKTDALSLIDSATAGEIVAFVYNENTIGYMKDNFTFTPDVSNTNSMHNTQNVSANIVDTLNLACESAVLSFYVDDQAFAISSSDILFENRGNEITLKLPETGIVQAITINGKPVPVTGDGIGTDKKFTVTWEGTALIPTGSSISVAYQDEAGHNVESAGTVAQSSVSTPITFVIRPGLNTNGYLDGRERGRSNYLSVSGTACACEPIKVTVANMTETTYATQSEVWSDSNGSWELIFDMSRLPEGEDFIISAEYMDVKGTSYSITAKYNAFCASASVTSPVFEAMTHISGMVEPGTAVVLCVNGKDYYKMDVDRFGRFSMDDVPMMFAGEDYFDIYVTDIAGNTSIRHYEIEEPGDPYELTGLVNPLGKFFYSAEEKDSVVYSATPVSANDFTEEKDTIELPLLMGASYVVGTMALEKTENGFKVSSELMIPEDVDSEDYHVENETLYVYTNEPTLKDLKEKTGQEYKHGEEILLEEGKTVWIVDNKTLTILADGIMELELFDYENSEEYVKYQEQ